MSTLKTGERKTSRSVSKSVAVKAAAGTQGYNECDTNADTCVLGSNFVVISMTQRTADVYPYDKAYKPIANVPIVSGATAWDDEFTGQTYILVFNESLFYGTKLDHSLLNPNQLRAHGIGVWDNPYDKMRPLEIETGLGANIPLSFKGTKLRFSSRVPTNRELETCPHIDMTSRREWNPDTVILGKLTSSPDIKPLVISVGKTISVNTPCSRTTKHSRRYNLIGRDEYLLHTVEPTLVELRERLISAIDISPTRLDDIPARRTFVSHDRHSSLTAESIAEAWCIGIKRARQTLTATTQRGVRSAILPLSRRYRADRRYNLKRLNDKFATDTLYAEVKSLHQNIAAQIYSHKMGFAACYPITELNGNSIGNTLRNFCNDFGVPEYLKFDGAMVQIGRNTLFQQLINMYDIKFKVSEPRRPNQNPAESAIREVKKRWYRVMIKKSVPKRFWDYGIVWICETGNITVSSSRYANGRTPLEHVTGETPDISEYLDFGFYDWVVFKSNAGLGEEQLGRWLGVSHKVGDLMSYWILPISGKVISCVTVQRLTRMDQTKEDTKLRMKQFDDEIAAKLDATNIDQSSKLQEQPKWNRLSLEEEDIDFIEDFNRVINDASIPEVDRPNGESNQSFTPDAFDSYIGMEVGMPRGDDDNLMHARVKRRAVDVDGNPVGVKNNNPLLDTRMYELEYVDGTLEHVSANVIAESLLAQVDEEGHRQLLLQEIIDHRVLENAVKIEDGFISNKNGARKRVKTTRGWEVCVEWKDVQIGYHLRISNTRIQCSWRSMQLEISSRMSRHLHGGSPIQ